ncbi:transcription-repair coupling factor [Ancylothrix sp. C2]|uniref:transcription-repair coupling factor n=1 Tax=Ancylothrix sp. D3o TaxID=2953691 RepID=UPI0021BB13A3|nr:transcription-repair coupling factor [Ancylothrix sp. D3o]MCT7952455.1 transcription-repair coupling factor [Ancylothrix sp. D3o]
MSFSAITRAIGRTQLASELLTKLHRHRQLTLTGIPRLPKGLVSTALAQTENRNILVITATLEEAGRWAAQLEAMGWPTVHFYPTSEASPYEPFDSEAETTWGQMQALADLLQNQNSSQKNIAIVATERALQPHLPPLETFKPYCLTINKQNHSQEQTQTNQTWNLEQLSQKLAKMGYERVPQVEMEGQWSRRGDIVDIFAVSAELPVRLNWFGDELEDIREFDPATQRSLEKTDHVILTPTDFGHLIREALQDNLPLQEDEPKTGVKRYLGLAFEKPASLLDYLAENTLIVIDEPEQCKAHSQRWLEQVEQHWQTVGKQQNLIKIHRPFNQSFIDIQKFEYLAVSELTDSTENTHQKSEQSATSPSLNLASRSVPVTPHQFAKLAEITRSEKDRGFAVFLISAQPSRSVSLLQEHDCPAQFVANPRDFKTIDKLAISHTPVALRYNGLAELEGFILPTFRLMVVTDREFFGQHTLATPSYVRKRRSSAFKQIDPNKLQAGDFVVHRHHGVGKFTKLEPFQNREYLVVQYADGVLRVPADQLSSLSRYRTTDGQPPELHKLTGKSWESVKNKVRKSVKKLALDLLKLYAKRTQQQGFAYPPDSPWQQEMEDSFPYKPTADQLKATQDIKRDMESERPMDRLVCGDVGFGKTEVAIRAIFKAVTAGKQVAFMAPTTILTQQHYHTLKERFAPYPIQIGLLNRFRSAEERRDIQRRLATGELDIVVGTQALLSKNMEIRNLGLLVVDEEQRFGVNQKEKIKAMKTLVDVLTLSATPIPRTLYMSLSGVREMSLISTPPASRRPIQTHLAAYNTETIRSAIRQELDRGGQVFYVVRLVEGIEETAEMLRLLIPGARIAVAHGQMDDSELESTMLSFSSGEADILLCTTIIESGLDIPRVNTILIEDAHRFGLAQLYQLRGRVGRSGIQAHAWMFYSKQNMLSEAARQRLRAIQEFTQLGSGYQLAVRDMEIRGVGNLLGAEQSGQMEAIGFDLYMEMLEEAIREIKGQEIPKVEDTQIDLHLVAFIPADYIPDLDQKMSAYRAVATAQSKQELLQIELDWRDRYGLIPVSAHQLLRVMELKQLGKKLGFSRIKPEGKQHIVLETPMEEPAWNLLMGNLPDHLHSKFAYSRGRVTVRGLGVLKSNQQLDYLIDWFTKMQGAVPEVSLV